MFNYLIPEDLRESVKKIDTLNGKIQQNDMEINGMYRKLQELDCEIDKINTQNIEDLRESIKKIDTFNGKIQQNDMEINGMYRKLQELDCEIDKINTQNTIKYKIKKTVDKIILHYNWILSIKTWKAKFQSNNQSTPCFEKELTNSELDDLQNTLIPNKIYCFESTKKIMEKYFNSYKCSIVGSDDKHYIFATTDQRGPACFVENIINKHKFKVIDNSRNCIVFGYDQCEVINSGYCKFYDGFVLSMKDIGETDEEFELRFLIHLLNVCQEAYSNYKIYIASK